MNTRKYMYLYLVLVNLISNTIHMGDFHVYQGDNWTRYLYLTFGYFLYHLLSVADDVHTI